MLRRGNYKSARSLGSGLSLAVRAGPTGVRVTRLLVWPPSGIPSGSQGGKRRPRSRRARGSPGAKRAEHHPSVGRGASMLARSRRLSASTSSRLRMMACSCATVVRAPVPGWDRRRGRPGRSSGSESSREKALKVRGHVVCGGKVLETFRRQRNDGRSTAGFPTVPSRRVGRVRIYRRPTRIRGRRVLGDARHVSSVRTR